MASPELQAIVEQLRTSWALAGATVEQQRATIGAAAAAWVAPEGTDVAEVDAGGVPALWVTTPEAAADRAVLYLHGGAYCIGSVQTHRGLGDGVSRAAGARVLLVDYRLAPEHPHPAAVDDAVAAYRWLVEMEGVAPASIAIAGDSAGGGLTVATLVTLRDAGLPLAACGVCLSPWADLTGAAESWVAKADLDPLCSPDGLKQMADRYLAGRDPRDPLASPLFADLAGLPPLLVQVGSSEILLDDATGLAARAADAGVDVTLEVWDDMIHVFQAFAAVLPEGRQAIDRIGAYLREHLA